MKIPFDVFLEERFEWGNMPFVWHWHYKSWFPQTDYIFDHFGNLITNISTMDLSAARAPKRQFEVSVGPHRIGPIRTTYDDVPSGQAVALIGGAQMLEITVNRGSAAEVLGVTRGTPVCLR